MSESKIRGTCESCGKVFRVPSAERTYTCKACGGEVSATPAEAAGAEASHVVTEEEHVPRFGARWRETHPTRRWSWRGITLILALIVVAGGYGGYVVLGALAPPPDIQATTGELVQSWEAGDLDALAAFHHPAKRADFRHRLQAIAEHRGWQAGFPAVGSQTAQVTQGSSEQPELASSTLSFDGGWAKLDWQFEPSRNCWYLYGFTLAPLPLAERAEAFRAAWASSSPEAMRPFFLEDSGDKWVDLFARRARLGGWGERWPELGAPRITGEEELLASPQMPPPHKLECAYVFPGSGELLVRWGHYVKTDEWLVTGIDFP
jgi:hypothetical protein